MSEIIKAEIYLTGIALYDKDKAVDVFDLVDPDLIETEEIRDIFLKARSHWKKNGILDWSVFSITLSEDEKLNAEFCRSQYAPSLDPKELAQTLRDEVSVERAKRIADRLMSIKSAEEITDFISELQKVSKGVAPMRRKTFAEYMADFMSSKTQPKTFIRTGYKKIDDDVLIDKGDFVILIGEQSAGKTAFSISLAINFAKQGYKVAYFSLETDSDGIFDRGTAISTGAKFGRLLRNSINEEDIERVSEKSEDLSNLPITVFDSATVNVDMIRRMALEEKADIIFIDYVGLIQSPGDVYERSTAISVGLHNLAQAEGITVVALAQKNRESNKSNDKGMHSIAGSGQFESDADLIFNLVRAEERNGQDRWQTTLHISKNKKGRVDDIDMWFDGTTQKFTEMTDFEISERNRPVSVYHDVLKK